MNLDGKRFLVIGGAGLIGSHTIEHLLKEDVREIRIYDNFTRGNYRNISAALSDPRVNVFKDGGDILHRDVLNAAMKDIDGVFHFAALWLLHCQDYPRSAFEVNIGGTFNVLEAMLNNNVRRLVYSSSASVYGDAIVEPMTEMHPYNNENFYGATKISGERLCKSLYHRFKNDENHFDYVGLRYMNVYGPRQDYKGAYISVIMKMLDNIDRGEAPVIYGDGEQAYDFIYVEDCARANILAMMSDRTDEFYNVGSGIKTTINELSLLLLTKCGSSLMPKREAAGQTFVRNRIGCTKKAKSDLGFESEVLLEGGIE